MLIQFPVSYVFYKSIVNNFGFIIYNVFMDMLSFSVVVVVSRIVNLKHIEGFYE